ncbi:MAG: hypothetical protein FD122_2665 [Stygiobacter sp.]|nr:MAG: hypothetical protein FD122_2665 [Stygiobacter sp.]KAF0215201.1 MAG: hypothetical protein FD178_1840 [Ignavibacteria bacterium]
MKNQKVEIGKTGEQVETEKNKHKSLINSGENKDLAGCILDIQNRLSENNNELFAIRGYIQLMKCYFQDEHFQEQSGFPEENYFGIIDLSRKMLDTLDSAMGELCNCNDSLGKLKTNLKEVK